MLGVYCCRFHCYTYFLTNQYQANAVHCIISGASYFIRSRLPSQKEKHCQCFQTNMAAMTELEEFVDIDHDTEFLTADVADI